MAESDRQFADKMGTGQMAPLWDVMGHLVRAEPAQNCAPHGWAFARSGAAITPRRNTESHVLIVVEGASTNCIDDKEFGFADRAAQRALGLCRPEGYAV